MNFWKGKNTQKNLNSTVTEAVEKKYNIVIKVNKLNSKNTPQVSSELNQSFGKTNKQLENIKSSQGLMSIPKLNKVASISSNSPASSKLTKQQISPNRQAEAQKSKLGYTTKGEVGQNGVTNRIERKNEGYQIQSAMQKTNNFLSVKQINQTSKYRKLSENLDNQNSKQKKLDLKDKGQRIQSQNNLGAKEQGCNRMKLRDYIYMTQKSSSNSRLHASNTKQKQEPAQIDIKKLVSPLIKQSKSSNQILSKIPVSPLIRKNSANLKYQISNSDMFAILKKQIIDDIKVAQQCLKRSIKMIEDTECKQIPSNDQLLMLYKMRREIKDVVIKKCQALESAAKLQPKNKGQLSEKQQSEQQKKISQFLRQHL